MFKVIKKKTKNKDYFVKIFFQENMGEQKKESIMAAFNYLIENSNKYEIDLSKIKNSNLYAMTICGEDFFTDCTKTLQDGFSGGVSHFMSFYSLFKELLINREIAFTGKLENDGKISKIGGIGKKILAAERSGIKIIFVPFANMRDVVFFLKKEQRLIEMEIIFVSEIDQILEKNIFKNKNTL